MNTREISLRDIKSLTKISGRPVQIGGQHTGAIDRTIIAENEIIHVKIEMNAYPSQHQNREMALLLMDMIIEDVIK